MRRDHIKWSSTHDQFMSDYLRVQAECTARVCHMYAMAPMLPCSDVQSWSAELTLPQPDQQAAQGALLSLRQSQKCSARRAPGKPDSACRSTLGKIGVPPRGLLASCAIAPGSKETPMPSCVQHPPSVDARH
mmetsp:Transcript_6472/g.10952  ORF Transcript_6472/g.10952 Transcript_6472/m.10952 type:complete len:132 (+) Transcript_6472:180-575(+)